MIRPRRVAASPGALRRVFVAAPLATLAGAIGAAVPRSALGAPARAAAGAGSAAPGGGSVRVAVAANFGPPLADLAEAFTAATGHRIQASAGATGKFYSQIVLGGAPFDVLLSADEETPRRLVAEGHAVAGTAFTYAIGQLVLWSADAGRVDAEGQVLARGGFRRLAIANPKTAPYGRAAADTLQALGLAEALAPRLVTADSVAQAYQFVASGNAELGFVALAQLQVPGKAAGGSAWPVPARLHREIRQDAVLLKAGSANPAAVALLQFLRSPATRARLAAYGYR